MLKGKHMNQGIWRVGKPLWLAYHPPIYEDCVKDRHK